MWSSSVAICWLLTSWFFSFSENQTESFLHFADPVSKDLHWVPPSEQDDISLFPQSAQVTLSKCGKSCWKFTASLCSSTLLYMQWALGLLLTPHSGKQPWLSSWGSPCTRANIVICAKNSLWRHLWPLQIHYHVMDSNHVCSASVHLQNTEKALVVTTRPKTQTGKMMAILSWERFTPALL